MRKQRRRFKSSSLYPSSVTANAGLCQTWSEIPKAGFLASRLNYYNYGHVIPTPSHENRVLHENRVFGIFRPGPEVIKLFSFSTQLSMKFKALIIAEITKHG